MTAARSSSLGPLVLLWLAGNCLRLTILAVPPVLALIILDLKLTGTQVGILNAIPVCLFALAAVPGSLLIARAGAVPAAIIGLLITAAGSALRGFASDAMVLYLATLVMAAGVAVMQPALPPIVRQWVPNRIGFATAVYANGLLFGEIFPVVFAGVLLPVLSGSWRASLVFWSIPVAIVALVIFLLQPGGKSAPVSRPSRWMPNWRDPLLWNIGLMLGGANQLYFCANAFLPGYLLQTGRTDLITVALTALNAGQLPASFVLLARASKWERKKWPLIGAGLVGLGGVIAILAVPAPWGVIGGATMIGLSCATMLTLVLAMPALLVSPDDVPRMSAGVFVIGYSMGVIVSIIAGIVWDLSGDAAYAFIPIGIAGLAMILFALPIDFSRRYS